MTYRALRINQKPATQAEEPKGAFDCDSCDGTGSGGMGVGCTDCLGTGIDPHSSTGAAGAEVTDEQILSAWKHVSVWGFSTDEDRIARAREVLSLQQGKK